MPGTVLGPMCIPRWVRPSSALELPVCGNPNLELMEACSHRGADNVQFGGQPRKAS